MYLSVRVKFSIALTFAIAWVLFSTYIALQWIDDLSVYVGLGTAWLLVGLIALLPGFMNAFIMSSFILDKRPKKNGHSVAWNFYTSAGS